MQKLKILLSVGAGKLPRVVGVPVSPALNLRAVYFSVPEGADPFAMTSFFRILTDDPTVRFTISKILPDVLSFF
jgi:hypothetical protein